MDVKTIKAHIFIKQNVQKDGLGERTEEVHVQEKKTVSNKN